MKQLRKIERNGLAFVQPVRVAKEDLDLARGMNRKGRRVAASRFKPQFKRSFSLQTARARAQYLKSAA